MNDDTSRSGQARPAKSPPALIITIELEQPGVILFRADTYEDELRLRSWLRRSCAMCELPHLLERLLDDIDEIRPAA